MKTILATVLALVVWLSVVTPASAVSVSLVPPTPIASTLMASAKGSLFSFSGTRPTNLGVKDGQLSACPGSPNCVSSQSPDTDTQHKIAPLSYRSDRAIALSNLKTVINSMERTAIITESENYLYAEFTTSLMGFVDDVEFYLDPVAQVIHVRSASRLGQSDLGVNRKRVEAIRAQFDALESRT